MPQVRHLKTFGFELNEGMVSLPRRGKFTPLSATLITPTYGLKSLFKLSDDRKEGSLTSLSHLDIQYIVHDVEPGKVIYQKILHPWETHFFDFKAHPTSGPIHIHVTAETQSLE
jgi:hypothetical protein